MILTVLFAATVLTSTVQDFYPMNPGAKWTYVDGSGLQTVDEIGQPVDIGKGQTAIPKTTTVNGQASGAELYQFVGDTLYLVGFINDHAAPPAPRINLLGDAQPILKVGAEKANWKFTGNSPSELGPVTVRIDSDSHTGPKRTVLGKQVETLLVHIVLKFGNGRNVGEIVQDVVYGKGIGMVELNETRKMGKQPVTRKLTLTQYDPPKG